MSVNEFKIRLFRAILDLLWRQWSSLGIPGQIAGNGRDYVIDPEMLLLFSARFCRFEPRLYDLVTEWLQINESRINLSRLRGVLKKSHWADIASLGFMAHCVGAGGARRWKKFAADWKPAEKMEAETMFLTIDNEPNDFVRNPDPAALEYGFRRNMYERSGKAMTFPRDRDAAFLFQLRGAFGLSARAETVLALLNQKICKIQDIAEITGFVWKSVQDAAEELCVSGLVVKTGYRYYLNDPQAMLSIFGRKQGIFPRWDRLYDALAVLWESVSNPRLSELSEATFHGEIRQVFEEQIKDSLMDVGIPELNFMNPDKIESLPGLLEVI